jgi:phage shock protein C
MSEQKRFLRATEGRAIGGVCMGLAHYTGIDVVIIRIAFVLLALNGLGFWIYFLVWLLVPDDAHRELSTEAAVSANLSDMSAQVRSMGLSIGKDGGGMLIGLVLVVLGAVLLGSHFIPGINFAMLWPLLLIGLGVFVLVRRR